MSSRKPKQIQISETTNATRMHLRYRSALTERVFASAVLFFVEDA